MIELFASDSAIVLCCCLGLAVTAVAIVRDARERAIAATPRAATVRELVTEDVGAEAA